MSDKSEFVYVVYISTTPEKLWQALTDGDFTYKYWGGRRITGDWRVGGKMQHVREDGGLDFVGEVLVCEPPHRLSYTFDVQPDPQRRNVDGQLVAEINEPPSRVAFEIGEFHGQVRLMLRHDQFIPGSQKLAGVSTGWPAILSSLKSLLETGEALFPNWR